MNTYMNMLEWEDDAIPHRLWIERLDNNHTRLCMKVIKDVDPEMLYLELPVSQEKVIGAWQGRAAAVSDAYDDGCLYSQVRSLFNLDNGCVIWNVTHIQLTDKRKMSADKLAFIPGMTHDHGLLKPILETV
ncbi:hypothetical protein [Photobacterium satsumensis]|uniref:hypothetical protein n=1 Tax=Photobacterium satsumensis TaxID=2910239 RepID=UPI003D0CC1C1